MLVIADTVHRENQTLFIQVPGATAFLKGWIEAGAEGGEPLSLRFAVGVSGNQTVIVLGVRRNGRGFDVGIPKVFWDELSGAPDEIQLAYGEDQSLTLEFPEESFEEFLGLTQKQSQEFPERGAIAEVTQHFFSEEESSYVSGN